MGSHHFGCDQSTCWTSGVIKVSATKRSQAVPPGLVVTPAFSLKEFGMHLFAPFSELGAPFFFSFYFVMIDLLFIYIKKKKKGKGKVCSSS